MLPLRVEGKGLEEPRNLGLGAESFSGNWGLGSRGLGFFRKLGFKVEGFRVFF